jgi:hypothetical protein
MRAKMKKILLFIVLTFSLFSYSAFCQLATHVVIAEIYAGGGNGGKAPYTNDYIVLYNPTGSSVDVSSWSLQYSFTTLALPNWVRVDLVGNIPAGSYYLIQLKSGGTVTNSLPYYPDVTDITVALKKGVGKVALVNNQTTLTADPVLPDASIIDFVGYGATDLSEGSPAPALTDRKSIRRKTNSNTSDYNYGTDGSGWDSQDNSTDFYFQNNLLLIPNQPLSTSPLANHVVIAEVYGGGGPAGTYRYDYVVLYNPSADTHDISAWNLQYYNGSSWDIEYLTGTISPNAYYLIQLGDGGSGNPLPVTPNLIGSANIDETNGTVALLRDTVPLLTPDPLLTPRSDRIVDYIGYGSVSGYEGTVGPAPSPGATSSIRRKDNSGGSTYGTNGSGWDSNDNSSNTYSQGSPVPLPVELSSFTASITEGGVMLNWVTATEVNNYGFNIERKNDVEDWNELGFVEGHGNSNSPKEYSFVDNSVVSGKYSYRLKQIDNDGTYEYFDVISVDVDIPDNFYLAQNYPNPFNPTTTIKYMISNDEKVSLKIYDLLGKEVASLVNEYQKAGTYSVEFNGDNLASGVYIYRLVTGGYVSVNRMSLIK